jgi:hypothetical protein
LQTRAEKVARLLAACFIDGSVPDKRTFFFIFKKLYKKALALFYFQSGANVFTKKCVLQESIQNSIKNYTLYKFVIVCCIARSYSEQIALYALTCSFSALHDEEPESAGDDRHLILNHRAGNLVFDGPGPDRSYLA